MESCYLGKGRLAGSKTWQVSIYVLLMRRLERYLPTKILIAAWNYCVVNLPFRMLLPIFRHCI